MLKQYSDASTLFSPEVQLDESLFRSWNESSSAERSENIQLPDTVTKLMTPYRSTVYVVGTAHFSESSQEDVRKVRILLFLLFFSVRFQEL
jgi:hypothetical protein